MAKMQYNLTRKRLEIMTKKIGWSVSKSNNGWSDFIINHHGESTALSVLSDRIEFRGGRETFGKKGSKYGSCGCIWFCFKNCKIELTDKHCITIMGNEGAFIQLRSFKP